MDLYTEKDPNSMDPLTTLTSNLSLPEYDNYMEDEDILMERIDKIMAERQFDGNDYYAIFNLGKECTDLELKEAYKRLSRTFHPDKHTDPTKRYIAQERFQLLQRAYEVLSDPNMRSIYDLYGERALSMPWTVGPLLKTPDQLRDEYERLARKKREEDIENLIRTETSMDIQGDISTLAHCGPGLSGFVTGLSRCKVARMSMKHTYNTQLTNNMSIGLTGSMVAQRGRGGGNVGVTIKHTVSPKLSMQYGMALFRSRVASIKSFYQPTSDSFINTRTTIPTLAHPPATIITVGRALSSSITGFMNFSTGDYSLGKWGLHGKYQPSSALSLGLASATEHLEYQAELQVGVSGSHLAGHYKPKLNSRTKGVISASLSNTSGLVVGLGAEHRVIAKTNIGGSLDVGYPAGISMRFSLSRLGQSLSIPLGVTNELSLSTILISLLAPLLSFVTVNQFIVVPWRKRRLETKLKELQELNASYLETKQQEASDAIALMSESVRRKAENEKLNGGLVIMKAIYGVFEKDHPTLNDKAIDVTIPVQNLVVESQLHIPGGHSKSKILGFYDPSFGLPKQLYIQYRFNHKIHKVIIKDNSSIILPLRAHATSA